MAFETTALYALPLALLGLILWFRVTLMRASLKVSIGDADNPALHERIRQHGQPAGAAQGSGLPARHLVRSVTPPFLNPPFHCSQNPLENSPCNTCS
jgi:hypothetical protein